ncbi:MAG: hypothetical protein ACK5KV_14845 [Bacteroides graminisolvens]|jgi:hypothetical protein|uniref:Uncharacterized protein n=1 Tax=Bacteroides graminisolvens DSM 19988 = JCM 15093 TaxID=1121097 RepID=A0A069D5I1_9BACE|nr:hypothetical protein [Bacteroides graminisolvens]GAK38138.1 hypothetical protein JCM15093_3448 [Bacteroides graminisolvens DSM 19988 = JCM 15093]
MKFNVEYTGVAEERVLTYDIEECSFDIEPTVQEINLDIVVNKLNLTVVDNNKVIQVWGFCGFTTWIKSDCKVPQSTKGTLQVMDDLKAGVGSYRVNKEDFPVYINAQTGWVCIGNPEKSGNAVEFINNCIAVIDTYNEFVSLWLRPQTLPKI